MKTTLRSRRIVAGLMASVLFFDMHLVNVALAGELETRQRERASQVAFRRSRASADTLQLRPEWRVDNNAPARADAEDSAEKPARRNLWGRIKDFMKEDWAQTKEDFRKVGDWMKKPLTNFKIGWRRTREKLRSFRTKLFRGTKLFALSIIGKELSAEEEQVHMLLTAYIDEHGVETLLDVLDNSNDSALEQVSLAARKVDDPVLRSQLLQRYVAREYLRMREDLENKDPHEVATRIAQAEEVAAQQEVTDPDPTHWQKPNEFVPAPVYAPYFPFVQDPRAPQAADGSKENRSSISLQKVLVGLVAGAGLLLAGYFAFTTMTIAPFLAFISSLVSLYAVVKRGNMRFGQQVVVVQQPGFQQQYPGPYPVQPATEEPPPLVEVPDDLPPFPTPPGGGGSDPDPAPAPVPDPDPVAQTIPAPSPNSGKVNVNTADSDGLEELPGVGPATAAKLIKIRKKAPFRSLDDLLRIQGFGPKKVKAMAPYVTF